jgi:hypothetical protein
MPHIPVKSSASSSRLCSSAEDSGHNAIRKFASSPRSETVARRIFEVVMRFLSEAPGEPTATRCPPVIRVPWPPPESALPRGVDARNPQFSGSPPLLPALSGTATEPALNCRNASGRCRLRLVAVQNAEPVPGTETPSGVGALIAGFLRLSASPGNVST